MSETIIIALIGVVGTILGGAIGAYSQILSRRDEREAKQDQQSIQRLRGLVQSLRKEVIARIQLEELACERLGQVEDIPAITAKKELRAALKNKHNVERLMRRSSMELEVPLEVYELRAVLPQTDSETLATEDSTKAKQPVAENRYDAARP